MTTHAKEVMTGLTTNHGAQHPVVVGNHAGMRALLAAKGTKLTCPSTLQCRDTGPATRINLYFQVSLPHRL